MLAKKNNADTHSKNFYTVGVIKPTAKKKMDLYVRYRDILCGTFGVHALKIFQTVSEIHDQWSESMLGVRVIYIPTIISHNLLLMVFKSLSAEKKLDGTMILTKILGIVPIVAGDGPTVRYRSKLRAIDRTKRGSALKTLTNTQVYHWRQCSVSRKWRSCIFDKWKADVSKQISRILLDNQTN